MMTPIPAASTVPAPSAELAELARKFCMLGAGDDDLARLLEVPRATLDAWRAGDPVFAAAVRAGREVADATVAERLYARAIGYTLEAEKIFNNKGEIVREAYLERYPPDVAACIFWLRHRRAEWRELGAGADGGADRGGAGGLLAELEAAGERLRRAAEMPED